MCGVMVEFEPTRVTPVTRGRNEGLNFVNVVANSKGKGNGDPGGVGIAGRKLKCLNYGGEHLQSNCPKRCDKV